VRLTWRGIGLAVVVAAAFVLANAHGSRSLGAVVVPGVLVLVAGLWQVSRAASPTLIRESAENGTVGEQGVVDLTVESRDAGQLIVRDQLSAGVGTVEETSDASEWPWLFASVERISRLARGVSTVIGPRPNAERHEAVVRTLSGNTATYDIDFDARGEWTIGPATVIVRDVFGLFERVHEIEGSDTVLVYPRVRRLTPAAYRQLFAVADGRGGTERSAFDALREYRPGDPLRDIHWRTSAKRDELIVTEYAAGGVGERVQITATTTPGCMDAMAEATASLTIPLLESDVPVELHLDGDDVFADVEDQRAVLARLARLTAQDGSLTATGAPDRESDDGASVSSGSARGSVERSSAASRSDAHVRIDATPDGVRVSLGETTTPFESLLSASPSADPSESSQTWVSGLRSRLKRNASGTGIDRWMTP
jgi:uncharacterized protein (DUF58 family)